MSLFPSQLKNRPCGLSPGVWNCSAWVCHTSVFCSLLKSSSSRTMGQWGPAWVGQRNKRVVRDRSWIHVLPAMALRTRSNSNVGRSTSVTTQARGPWGFRSPCTPALPAGHFIPALLKPQIPLPAPPKRMTLLCTSPRNEDTSQSLPPAPACPRGWATPALPQANASICGRVPSFSPTWESLKHASRLYYLSFL